MRHKTALAIERLLASFPREPPDANTIRARTERYVNECGCAAGGSFLILAALAALVAVIVSHSWRIPVVLWCLAAIVAASIVGKLIGIAIATVRLQLLRRRLHRRIMAMEVTDVHLH